MSPNTSRLIRTIKNNFWHLPKAILANCLYLFPSKKLTLIGVTGTDGKTTTATLLYHLLKQAGFKTALISTVEAKIDDQTLQTGLHTTSPDPFKVQSLLSKCLQVGVTHVVCEVTSHALDQHRFWGCQFTASAITNISHEHLDYHQNLENYIQTKSLIFSQSDFAVLNRDDNSYQKINHLTPSPKTSYSISKTSPYQAKKIKITQNQLQFNCQKTNFVTDSTYRYQIYNILACLAIWDYLKQKRSVFQKTIKNFPFIKGRRQAVPDIKNIRCLIDFAHTPQALDQTLSTLKTTTKNLLITIFGATGGRDSSKRPLMGQAVFKHSHIGIITADDTRNEDIKDINQQIIAGIPKKKSLLVDHQQLKKTDIKKIRLLAKKKFIYFNVPARQDAFNLAALIAKKGDTIVACGKGHETTILHGKTEYPWSENNAFTTAFKNKNG